MKVDSAHREREERFARAEALLGEFFERKERGEPTSFEDFRAEHAAMGAELDQLYLAVSRFQSAMESTWEIPAGECAAAVGLLAPLATRPGNHGDYEVGPRIARGGMGEILAVRDRVLERDIVMKVVRGLTFGKAGTDRLRRFLKEARLTGRLDHPGIVPVHELGLGPNGQPYFTMKRVHGSDLSEIIQLARDGREGWNRTRVIGVIQRACEAVAYAHDRDVVHRDLKPENVRVGRFGEVYVMDWGLARDLKEPSRDDLGTSPAGAPGERPADSGGPSSTAHTRDGSVLGTPAYMAPEQASGNQALVGPRSDVYAIGAMLYHLIAGHRPYGDRELPGRAIVYRTLEGDAPTPLASLAPDSPPELLAIVGKAMARDPAGRYASALELAGDLQAYLEERVVRAHRTGAVVELVKWVRRNRPLASAIAGLLLVLTVGLATSLWLADQSGTRAREVQRLSALPRLAYLIDEADELWPARQESLPRYEKWLREARELLADPTILELRQTRPAEGLSPWSAAQLNEFYVGYHLLADPEEGLLSAGVSPTHGWSIPRRRDFAATVLERSLSGAEAATRWREAISSVQDRAQSPAYGGLVIAPQLGLQPIGRDPRSGLWEFAHLQTGQVPERDAAGQLDIGEETGLVFVLLPGGTLLLGAEPRGADPDPAAQPDEGPHHEVSLAPFFISKYEMTQGQWLRIQGSNPSYHGALRFTKSSNEDGLGHTVRLPVEQVSWNECVRLLGWLELELPSEARWEYAARGATGTPWWTGTAPGSLEGAANVADAFAQALEASWACESWSDGFFLPAPVGSFRPNPFGLHDVHGNVWEWCRDWYDPSFYSRSDDRDPVCEDSSSGSHVIRGGGFAEPSELQRVSYRNNNAPDAKDAGIGLRPVRRLDRD